MSVHFSKYLLNTYDATPYFHAHVPRDYPLSLVLQQCRAFRRLPPNLRELSERAKRWACRVWQHPAGIEGIQEWYDANGNELNPHTGVPLTEKEIDEAWERWSPPDIQVEDIPVPEGGFADPDTWEQPAKKEEPDLVDREGLTEGQVLSDIACRGRTRTAEEYGVPASWLSRVKSDDDLARIVLGMHGKPWPDAATEPKKETLRAESAEQN